MERLIFFDIDGTLTRTEQGYLPFNEAICQTFGVAADIRTVVPDGNTDPLIVKEIFATANVTIEIGDQEWQLFTENLRTSYQQHVERGLTKVRALPGALALLRALAGHGAFAASIVTGNFEVTAQVKLQAASLHWYLSRGAYASDSAHRPDLPAIAKQRWEERHGRAITSSQCIIVGDTPNDLAAARQNNMKCLLVGTGRYPVEELEYWRPDACLADLSATEEVLTTLASL
jgi:phosphoglycolate phosphatase-like HAD superfamily hydrolase